MHLFSRENLKRPEYTSFFVTFFAGLATHIFVLTNVMHNYDDIAAYPIGFGTGISSGRWFLEIVNRWSIRTGSAYNLTFINGLLFIVFIALASFFLVSVLDVKSKAIAGLMGVSFVVFPTAVSILLFRFTAHIYGLAVLLAVLSVWLIEKFRFSWLLSAVLLALSMGLYQAYFPLAVSICVMLIIKKLLERGENSGKACLIKGIFYCGVLVLGLLIYLAAQKFFMKIYGSSLNDYRGISNLFDYKISIIPSMMYEAVRSFLLMPFRDYCDIADMASIRSAYLLTELVTLILLVVCTFSKKRRFGDIFVLLLVCAVFPLAVNLIVLIAPEAELYTMMVYSFVAILWLPLILADILAVDGQKLHKAVSSLRKCAFVLVLFITLSYCYYANVNYSSQYFASKQTENYMNALVVQIRMTEGFDTDKDWAFVGQINDPLLENRWELGTRYGGSVTSDFLMHIYSQYDWIRLYFGYDIPFASYEAINEVKTRDEYKAMPYWPAEGSIKVIDDLVVVKFSD